MGKKVCTVVTSYATDALIEAIKAGISSLESKRVDLRRVHALHSHRGRLTSGKSLKSAEPGFARDVSRTALIQIRQ